MQQRKHGMYRGKGKKLLMPAKNEESKAASVPAQSGDCGRYSFAIRLLDRVDSAVQPVGTGAAQRIITSGFLELHEETAATSIYAVRLSPGVPARRRSRNSLAFWYAPRTEMADS